MNLWTSKIICLDIRLDYDNMKFFWRTLGVNNDRGLHEILEDLDGMMAGDDNKVLRMKLMMQFLRENESKNEERGHDRGEDVNISEGNEESNDNEDVMQLDADKMYFMKDVKVDTIELKIWMVFSSLEVVRTATRYYEN